MPSKNPFQPVRDFEAAMREYTGAPLAIAVDSGTSALFLSLKWCYDSHNRPGRTPIGSGMHTPNPAVLEVPRRTFISVPTAAVQAGWQPIFRDILWQGWYRLKPTYVYDSALRLRKGMFLEALRLQAQRELSPLMPPLFVCLSFQYRKHLPIGRGGMILTNSVAAREWLCKARFYGREECDLRRDSGPTFLGWRKYMTPDEAARGLCFLYNFPDRPKDIQIDYSDLAQLPVFKSGLQKMGEDQQGTD